MRSLRPRRIHALAVLLGGFGLVLPGTARASPWTLGQGQLVLSAGFDHQRAEEEFLDEGGARAFPLRGRFESTTLTLGIRAGFTDRLEFEAQLPIRTVSYDSDPVILLPPPEGSTEAAFDYYQRNVLRLDRSVSGVADFVIAGRYGWLRTPVAIATELRVKAPTGYQPPAGTFGERPTSREAFVANVRNFVAPENVQDDVTLGDGQLDLTASMLFGYAAPTGTFARLGVGYNLRLGDAGDQVVGDFKLGQAVGRKVLVFAGVRGGYTVERGEVIGISVAAIDPELPAEEYAGTDNLDLRERTLDRDYLDVGGGLIVRMSDRLELNLAYDHTVLGRNTAATHAFGVSLAFRSSFGR